MPEDKLKVITVLFADLTGFTELSSKLEPDEIKEILDQCFSGLSSYVEEEGGEVLKYEGDKIMAAFGLEKSSDRDPAHACYAALSMRCFLDKFNHPSLSRHGVRLKARFGIHIGNVVSGELGGRKDILGDAVNIAARLEQNAPVGEILISTALSKHLRSGFCLSKPYSLRVKGKVEPLCVQLVHARSLSGSRQIFGHVPGFIGRDKEILKATQLCAEAIRSSAPRALVFQAHAGVGKTRLLGEIREKITQEFGPIFFFKASFSSHNPSPFRAFQGLLYQWLDHYSLDDLESKKDQSQVESILQLLEQFFNLHDSEEQSEVRKNELCARAYNAMQIFLQTLSNHRPVLLLWDDMQWMDIASAELLAHVLSLSSGPLVLLGASRFEPEINIPPIDPCPLEISRVNHLDQGEMQSLLDSILGQTVGLPEGLSRRLLKSCQGIPFFLEELILEMHSQGFLEWANEQFHFRKQKERFRFPESIQLLVQTRIDRLSQSCQRLVESAAILGKRFKLGDLQILLEDDELENQLREAEESSLVLAHKDNLRFAHDYILQTAYERLTGRARRQLHKKIADHYAGDLAQANQFQGFLWTHFYRAQEWESALHWGLKLAFALCDRGQYSQAVSLLEKMEEIIREQSIHLPEETLTLILNKYAYVLRSIGDSRKFAVLLDGYLERFDFQPFNRASLLISYCSYLEQISDFGQWRLKLAEIGRIFQALGPLKPNQISNFIGYKLSVGTLERFELNFKPAMDHYHEALDIVSDLKGIQWKVIGARITNAIGAVYSDLYNHGAPREVLGLSRKDCQQRAVSCFRRALEIFRRYKVTINSANCCYNLAIEFNAAGQYQRAIRWTIKSYKEHQSVENRLGLSRASLHLGELYNRVGSIDQAEKAYLEGLKQSIACHHRYHTAISHRELFKLYVLQGRKDESRRHYEEALKILDGIKGMSNKEEWLERHFSELYSNQGQTTSQ